MENLDTKPKVDTSTNSFTYDEAVELTGHGRYNYQLLAVCCLITNACALDMFGYATVVAAASCDLNINLIQLGILVSAPFAGVLFAFPWGYFADTQGRKRALIISASIGFVFAATTAFSTHWIFMLVIKIIGSSFSTAGFSLTMAFLGECTGSKRRSQYLFIMHSFNIASETLCYGLALFILPLNFNVMIPILNISFRSWRLFTILLAIPLGIGACFMCFLYESPKFLASQGHSEKSLEVLRRIYERNGGKREDYLVKNIIQTGPEVSLKDQSFRESLKVQTVPIFKPPLLWRTIQLFFLTALCGTTNNAFFMWYPTMVNMFYKSFNTESSTDQTFCQRMFGDANSTSDDETVQCNDGISLNTIYSGMVCGLFFLSMSLAVIKVASRPRLVLISVLLVSGVSLLLANLKNPITNIIFFTLIMITCLGMGSCSTYFVNLYPTIHRGQVTSLGLMVARLCSLVSVIILGPIITQHCEVTFYAWSVLAFGGVVLSLFLPPDRRTSKSTANTSPNT